MKRHRWEAASDKPKRHHGRCEHCGLVRTRAPGSHATFFSWTDASGKVLNVDNTGRTPGCPPEIKP